MIAQQFDRDRLAELYAQRHLETDPATTEIYYLPTGSPEREIRLLEINTAIPSRIDDPVESLDFGIDAGRETPLRLMVVDVTPAEWQRIAEGKLRLPEGWSLSGKVHILPQRDRAE